MNNIKSELNPDFKEAHVTVQLSAEDNHLLTLAAQRSGRSKRQELVVRLSDHLKNVEDIVTTGKRFDR
ncbi:TraY domain-containing protein [Serratia liquefaciens]|uniref:TraY domain-containing protein n=1 Tax=Serratia liquefaciens TaxID=614 RepID=UPI00301E0ECA